MRINQCLQAARQRGRAALIPYITAGDPDLRVTEDILHALSEGGAEIIELGVPFSDPVADGPTLQAAAERALAAGTNLSGILEMVARVRQQGLETPIVLFSYFNPLYRLSRVRQQSLTATLREAKTAGIDGLLLVDVPVGSLADTDNDNPFAAAKAAQLERIGLCAPSLSAQRLKQLRALNPEAVYAIARLGITGAQQHLDADLIPRLQALQQRVQAPVMVGFGVSKAEHVAALENHVAGIVCGSALVAHLAAHAPAQQAEAAYGFMRGLRGLRHTQAV